jgi:hypothetical protein
VYVGSAESAEHDQVLESVLVGPIQLGLFKFVFQTPAPDISKIPEDEVVGVTAILYDSAWRNTSRGPSANSLMCAWSGAGLLANTKIKSSFALDGM